jgi:hypothetical protein
MKLDRHLVLTILSGLVFLPVASQGITAAWKVRIEDLAPNLGNNAKFHRLDQPPGESVFFHPGDELWDISQALAWPDHARDADDIPARDSAKVPMLDWKAWNGSWIVWDASTQRVVVDGSWEDLLTAASVLPLRRWPQFTRCTFELITGSGEKRKVRPVTVVSQQGFDMKVQAGGLELACEAHPSFQSVDCSSIRASWESETPGKRWDVEADAFLKPGERTLIAQHEGEAELWMLYLTAQGSEADGTFSTESQQVEINGRAEPWPRAKGPSSFTLTLPVDDKRSACYFPGIALKNLITAVGSPPPPVDVPAVLAPWVRGKLIDLTDLFKIKGIGSGPGFFAYYDPLIAQVIIIGDSQVQDLCKVLLASGESWPETSVWLESNPGSGGWGLMVKSGYEGHISFGDAGGKDPPSVFEVELTASTVGEHLDAHYLLDAGFSKSDVKSTIASSISMLGGHPVTVGKFQSKAGRETSIELTGRIFRIE